ncbi:MAG: ribonuclease J [Myxococcota bacterium]
MASLRIVPLGGLGEIGMNCLALETEGRLLVIDCGVTFPHRSLGRSLEHANLRFLEDRADDVEALVLTHGHEDHIGAVSFLLEAIPDLPVYGPEYALALVEQRLRERFDDDRRGRPGELEMVSPGERLDLGPFQVEPIRVTHSIVDATALAVSTPAGLLIHSGDFKIEEPAPDGQAFDRTRFRELGERGVRVLLSDSTNAMNEGHTGTEDSVRQALKERIRDAEGRVCVAVFASNVHRLRSLFSIAKDLGRQVCLLGRSVRRHVETAMDTGHLPDVSHRLVHEDDVLDLPRERVLMIATGTQGEAPTALARLARNDHPAARLDPGDSVILSSRIIPGNEREVFSMINQLARTGIHLTFGRMDPNIHVSGHARRDEQRTLLELTQPETFVPLHGTRLHLEAHAALAQESGVRDIHLIENGDVLEVTNGHAEVVDRIEVGRVVRDQRGEPLSPSLLRERSLLSSLGFAAVFVWLGDGNRVVGRPEIITRGFCEPEMEEALLRDAQLAVRDAVEARAARDMGEDLSEAAGMALKKFLGRRTGRRPLCRGIVRRLERS